MAHAITPRQKAVDFFKKATLVDVYNSNIPQSAKAEKLFIELFNEDIRVFDQFEQQSLLDKSQNENFLENSYQGRTEVLTALGLEAVYEEGAFTYKKLPRTNPVSTIGKALFSTPAAFASKLLKFRNPTAPAVNVDPLKP